MRYDFLLETYATERIKVLSVWSEFRDTDLEFRPNPNDSRGRSVHEQMVHQCVSEDIWLRTMLAVDVSAPPLPDEDGSVSGAGSRADGMAASAPASGVDEGSATGTGR